MTKLTANASIVAMVGKSKTPSNLAARMPSAEIAAKVGGDRVIVGNAMRRVVRLSA